MKWWTHFCDYWKQRIQKSKHSFKEKMIQNAMSRKSKYLKNKLHHNKKELDVLVQWLKNTQEVDDNLVCCFEIDYKHAYLITNQLSFNTFNYRTEVDLVIVDLNWKVLRLVKALKPNKQIKEFKNLCHLVVLAKNSIEVFGIKEKDILQPLNYL